MSVAVSRRLREMTDRGEERRRRISEIRWRSTLLISTLHRLSASNDQQIAREPAEATAPPSQPVYDASTEAPAGDGILGQVQHLMVEMDTREQEHWNEDDMVILISLQQALAAAARKGYAPQDVHAVLEALEKMGEQWS